MKPDGDQDNERIKKGNRARQLKVTVPCNKTRTLLITHSTLFFLQDIITSNVKPIPVLILQYNMN